MEIGEDQLKCMNNLNKETNRRIRRWGERARLSLGDYIMIFGGVHKGKKAVLKALSKHDPGSFLIQKSFLSHVNIKLFQIRLSNQAFKTHKIVRFWSSFAPKAWFCRLANPLWTQACFETWFGRAQRKCGLRAWNYLAGKLRSDRKT